MKPIRMIKALAVGSVLWGASAQALTVSFTDQLALADVEISGTLSVPKYDSSLGPLTGVTFTITGAIASILGVENRSTGAINGSAFTNVDFDVSSALLPLGGSPDFSVFASTGLVSLGVGASALFPVTESVIITGSVAPSADFLTPGTVDLDFLTTTSFGGNGFGGDIAISQATDAGISFTITYESAMVPPPAAALFMASVIGLGVLTSMSRRRRRP